MELYAMMLKNIGRQFHSIIFPEVGDSTCSMSERDMQNLTKLILLLLILSGVRAYGQDTRLTPPQWWWQSDSAHYRTAESLALPALLSFVPDGRPVSVSLNAQYRQRTPLPLQSIAQREWGYQIRANGGKRLGKFSVIGQACFSKVDEINLSHNLTNHAERFYPFVIADTVKKKLYAERYHTSFGASYSATPLIKIGIALGYTGEMRYARIDPRVQNISSEIYGTASVALDLGRWGQLSTGGTRQNYEQQLNFSVLKPGKSQLIYVMRPMGEYNFRYSGYEDQGSYRPLLTTNKAIMAWQLPQRNLVIFAEGTNTTTKMGTRQAGVIINKKKITQIASGLEMDLAKRWRSLGGQGGGR